MMRFNMLIIGTALMLAFGCASSEKNELRKRYGPLISTPEGACNISREIWRSYLGEPLPVEKYMFTAHCDNDSNWTVAGKHMPEGGFGGGLSMTLDRYTGGVVSLTVFK